MLRRLAVPLALSAALTVLGTAAPAQAALSVVKTKSDSYFDFGEVACGQNVQRTVSLGTRVGDIRVVEPHVGDSVDAYSGGVAGTISDIDVLRRSGRTSVRFSLTGSGDACAQEGSVVVDFTSYEIRYRYRLGRELRACGYVWLGGPSAGVKANGYVTCRGARSLVRAWRRQIRRERCTTRCKRRRRVRGFRCRDGSGHYVLWTNCRRGKRYVTWSWGD
jgi:hypothetical protein